CCHAVNMIDFKFSNFFAYYLLYDFICFALKKIITCPRKKTRLPKVKSRGESSSDKRGKARKASIGKTCSRVESEEKSRVKIEKSMTKKPEEKIFQTKVHHA
ncbi:MAG: hypothetical protein LUH54_01535, partial [Firmicutes bacterium]|nr:hypothetical protein [Bacillota bacterium]